jgi:hypothetical protein
MAQIQVADSLQNAKALGFEWVGAPFLVGRPRGRLTNCYVTVKGEVEAATKHANYFRPSVTQLSR